MSFKLKLNWETELIWLYNLCIMYRTFVKCKVLFSWQFLQIHIRKINIHFRPTFWGTRPPVNRTNDEEDVGNEVKMSWVASGTNYAPTITVRWLLHCHCGFYYSRQPTVKASRLFPRRLLMDDDERWNDFVRTIACAHLSHARTWHLICEIAWHCLPNANFMSHPQYYLTILFKPRRN